MAALDPQGLYDGDEVWHGPATKQQVRYLNVMIIMWEKCKD